MSLENPEQIVSIAPAEGQKPLNMMTDPDFDLMCNPDRFCYGEGSFGKMRERKQVIQVEKLVGLPPPALELLGRLY